MDRDITESYFKPEHEILESPTEGDGEYNTYIYIKVRQSFYNLALTDFKKLFQILMVLLCSFCLPRPLLLKQTKKIKGSF